MKHRTVFLLLAAVAVSAWAAGAAFTEDEPAKPMGEMEMWQKMQEWAQPGEHHKILGQLAGTWNTTGKIITGMGEIPIQGKAVNTWILGGRFLETKYEGPFMGGKFEGRGFAGYDNGRGQFQQAWMMTMASNIAYATGTWDAETRTLTWNSSTYMPDGHEYKNRETLEFKGAGHIVSSTYSTGPDGKEHKEMVLEYKRVVEGDK